MQAEGSHVAWDVMSTFHLAVCGGPHRLMRCYEWMNESALILSVLKNWLKASLV